jgi:uncharacterized membrane protein YhhN
VPFHRDVEDPLTRWLRATALGAALAYLVALWLSPPGLTLVAKPIPALCLAAMVLRRRSSYARIVGVGLVLSAAGDVLLEFPNRFLVGLLAFLLAHLFYIAAFLGRSRAPRGGLLLPFLAWTAAALAYLWPGLGPMRGPVAGYVAVITAMMWRAAAVGGSAAFYWAGQTGIALSALSRTAPAGAAPRAPPPRPPAPPPPTERRRP